MRVRVCVRVRVMYVVYLSCALRVQDSGLVPPFVLVSQGEASLCATTRGLLGRRGVVCERGNEGMSLAERGRVGGRGGPFASKPCLLAPVKKLYIRLFLPFLSAKILKGPAVAFAVIVPSTSAPVCTSTTAEARRYRTSAAKARVNVCKHLGHPVSQRVSSLQSSDVLEQNWPKSC